MIIDEEQEDTYKSENSPRYHARSVAKYLCAHSNALLLLGSATPNIVSMYAAKQGVYSLFRLDRRFNNRELPAVRIVDMKAELRMGNGGCISSVLRDAIQERVDRGEQSILFLNIGLSCLMANATPEIRPPPPIGTITASASGS